MHQRSRRFLLMGHLMLPALAFGMTWLSAAAPASACGRVYGNPSAAAAAPFGFQNGLRLGSPEAELLKTLGEPQAHQGAGVRCPSQRDRLVYDAQTIVVIDAAEPTGGSIHYQPHRLPHPIATQSPKPDRIIVRFTTQNPKYILSQNIRVGDRLDQLITAYGQPQTQSQQQGFTVLRYAHDREILQVKLKDDRIDTVELMLQTPSSTIARDH
jgi:hypothetical protein